MDKITEKEARQPDSFIQTVDRINTKLQPNKHIVIGVAIFAIVAAGVWATWDLYRQRRETQAQEALFIASHQIEKKEQEFEDAATKAKTPVKADKNGKVKAATPIESAASGELATRPKNIETDFGGPLKSMQSVVDMYPGTKASLIAALEIARVDQNYGQVDQGLQALQKINIGNQAGDLISATVQLRLGDLLQIKGDCDQAITKWNLVSGANGFDPLKPEALLRTGLCYENLKKYDEAKSTYEKLTQDKNLAESRAGREGKKFLKLLQASRRAT